MTQTAQHDIALKARKLAQLAADLRRGQDFPVTSVKNLCHPPLGSGVTTPPGWPKFCWDSVKFGSGRP
jgi:hypothetical protein